MHQSWHIPTDKFIIDADASDKAIGAELIQVQDGEEKVVMGATCLHQVSVTIVPHARSY